jgi:hypothetical protein
MNLASPRMKLVIFFPRLVKPAFAPKHTVSATSTALLPPWIGEMGRMLDHSKMSSSS